MSTEIKIVHHPIDQAMTTLKGSVQSFQASLPSEIKGDNQLEFLKQVNDLNEAYSALLNDYQTLIRQHIEVTEESIEAIKRTDQSLANFSLYKLN